MSGGKRPLTYLADYTPPDYLVATVDLRFDLDESATRVKSRLRMRRNPDIPAPSPPLVLQGEHLLLRQVVLDNHSLTESDYRLTPTTLTIDGVPAEFTLEIETQINPADNTALEGLYLSGGNFCTQCEAEGFRRITYFPDRPDVMARFTTTIVAHRRRYPVLLAGGNRIEAGELADGRHFVTWQDPFRKPCYLFALVAGDLVRISDTFRTRSGRPVALDIYVEKQNRDKCDHAMASLKKAMAWDEEVYGLEYDLDTYMIVAVDDFNMGAMENKGLNIFNSKFVLARPDTATDADYAAIEGVIAHEYFHNWTGNRITCRDWFQLSLKEGLTVFRDQEFSADMGSRPVQRIKDVSVIRSSQFREDAGPMAHPVRPDSYMEINNFYTVTVYNKGAELIRMIHTLLGKELFFKGMRLYIRRHDGQAVTCDHFIRAMADGSGVDLDRFRNWYTQAGTPEIRVSSVYDADKATYDLTLEQSCPPTPGQEKKQPFHIPVAMALLDGRGREMELAPAAKNGAAETTRVLELRRERQTFRFTGIDEKPVLSILRNFSAPVRVSGAYEDAELAFLLAHDSDPFNRWDAGQQLALRLLLRGVDRLQQGKEFTVPENFLAAFRNVLLAEEEDAAFRSLVLTLPTEEWIAQQLEVIDPVAVSAARRRLQSRISRELAPELLRIYQRNQSHAPYRYSAEAAGKRRLKNICLSYLAHRHEEGGADRENLELCRRQYLRKDNMTDVLAALAAVVHADAELGEELLADFETDWRQEPLVMDKWLAIQATSPLDGALDRVRNLMDHPLFSMDNPNRIRALIGSFCQRNQAGFHDESGAGYAFLADQVITLDRKNPQIASRLLAPLTSWRRYDAHRRQFMRAALQRIGRRTSSTDVGEVIAKSLA